MSLRETITADMLAAMKAATDEPGKLRRDVLRMVKSALDLVAKEHNGAVDEVQVLTKLVNQRKDSIEAFVKAERHELADKERAEIVILEAYLPTEAAPDVLELFVATAILMVKDSGATITMKSMGAILTKTKELLAVPGFRADGKALADEVKKQIAGAA